MSAGNPTRLEFTTPLPPEECERRLRRAVEMRQLHSEPGECDPRMEVLGGVERHSFKLRRYHDRRDLNNFAPILVGRMEPFPDGTRVRAKFRLPLFTLIFMPIFLLIAANFIVFAFAASKAGFGWPLVAIALLITAPPFVFYATTRKRAAQQRAYLRDFLLATLEAQPTGASSVAPDQH